MPKNTTKKLKPRNYVGGFSKKILNGLQKINQKFTERDTQIQSLLNENASQAQIIAAQQVTIANQEQIIYNASKLNIYSGATGLSVPSLPRYEDITLNFDPDQTAGEQSQIINNYSNVTTTVSNSNPQELFSFFYKTINDLEHAFSNHIDRMRFDHEGKLHSDINPTLIKQNTLAYHQLLSNLRPIYNEIGGIIIDRNNTIQQLQIELDGLTEYFIEKQAQQKNDTQGGSSSSSSAGPTKKLKLGS